MVAVTIVNVCVPVIVDEFNVEIVFAIEFAFNCIFFAKCLNVCMAPEFQKFFITYYYLF